MMQGNLSALFDSTNQYQERSRVLVLFHPEFSLAPPVYNKRQILAIMEAKYESRFMKHLGDEALILPVEYGLWRISC
jgi:hypothetical protein